MRLLWAKPSEQSEMRIVIVPKQSHCRKEWEFQFVTPNKQISYV